MLNYLYVELINPPAHAVIRNRNMNVQRKQHRCFCRCVHVFFTSPLMQMHYLLYTQSESQSVYLRFAEGCFAPFCYLG